VSYLARLKAFNAGDRARAELTKLTKAPSVSFVSDRWAQDDRRMAVAERPAIVQYDAKVPADWAQWFARLDPTRPPDGVSTEAWLATVNGIGRALDTWGRAADDLGWAPGELFRLPREGPRLFATAEIVLVTSDALWLRDGPTIRTIPRAARQGGTP
jgi:hypothetical protein